jgi:hypothetical protein
MDRPRSTMIEERRQAELTYLRLGRDGCDGASGETVHATVRC